MNSELLALGADAILIAVANDETPVTIQPSNVVLCSPNRPHSLYNSLSLFRAIWGKSRNAAIIHIHGQYLLPNVYAYLIARARKRPYGLQPHGTMEPYQRAQSSIKKRVYDAAIGIRIRRNASYVLFSDLTEARAAEDLVPREKWIIAPLGVRLAQPGTGDALSIDREIRRDRRVLFLGRLAKKKNPDLLLQAWASSCRRDGWKLVIAGPDDDWSANELRRMAAELKISDVVDFPGEVTGPTKTWLLENSCIFVLPSDNENFSISVAEAMAAGCHVITTAQVAASSHLTAAISGDILTGPDLGHLKLRLEEAMNTPSEEINESGRRAQIYALQNLTWRPIAKKLYAEGMRHIK